MSIHTISRKIRHLFYVVSNVRPIVWIGLYIALTPIFACIYWALPDGQFRIPDGGTTDFGSWLYYSIVTITTLGFGDYTPAHGWAQALTAVEVMCGVVFIGFFLNAVGSMKSEIDVESEIEKQRMLHEKQESDKLRRNIPSIMHTLNTFLAYCYAVTTPESKRGDEAHYDPDFTFSDMRDLFSPSGLPIDRTHLPAVSRLISSAQHTSLALDSLQNRVDLALWPDVLEDCFGFVADWQMFSSTDALSVHPTSLVPSGDSDTLTPEEKKVSAEIAAWQGAPDVKDNPELAAVSELYFFIKKAAGYATRLETALTKLGASA